MKRPDQVDRWLHGEENRANQEKPICRSGQRSEKEERTAYDKAQRGAEIDSGADDLVSPVDLEVPWRQVIESRIQQLHLSALPGDRESKRPGPDGLSTTSEVQVTDSSPKDSFPPAGSPGESDQAELAAGSRRSPLPRGRMAIGFTLSESDRRVVTASVPSGSLHRPRRERWNRYRGRKRPRVGGAFRGLLARAELS